MKCENYWCKHWNCNECNIAPNIHLDEDGVCISIEEEKSMKTVLERKEWHYRDKNKFLFIDE